MRLSRRSRSAATRCTSASVTLAHRSRLQEVQPPVALGDRFRERTPTRSGSVKPLSQSFSHCVRARSSSSAVTGSPAQRIDASPASRRAPCRRPAPARAAAPTNSGAGSASGQREAAGRWPRAAARPGACAGGPPGVSPSTWRQQLAGGEVGVRGRRHVVADVDQRRAADAAQRHAALAVLRRVERVGRAAACASACGIGPNDSRHPAPAPAPASKRPETISVALSGW